ncbi:MAG: hypothetical protein RUMPE_00170 [Eubacteriales bacterium SKADARSKE-1]|nr:hypothetical protein [Eubacteriales bacterium SKADARSKE-1]
MTFDSFAGNLLLKEQLYSLFKSKKVPHCMIFEGPNGSGKKTIADIIARALVCSSDDIFSCDNCLNCKKVINKTHPDVIYPEKSGALQSFSVATARKIREDAYVIPNEAKHKVYIFQDANNMNSSAQNALLKILEEPPKNVIFIFICESSSSFLDTIKSRSQIFSVVNVSKKEAFDFICKNYPEFNENEINNAVLKSGENIGKTIEILNSSDLSEILELAEQIAKTLVLSNEFELLKISGKISTDRKNLRLLLNFLAEILRDALVGDIKNEISRNLSQQISQKKILSLINIVNKTNDLVSYNANGALLITYFTSNFYMAVLSD